MSSASVTPLLGFLILFGISAIGAIVYFAIVVSRRQTKQMDDFLARFGLPIVSTGEIASITEGPITIHYQILPLGRGKKPQLSLWYEHRNNGHLNVRRENWIDRFFKRLGIVAEVQTNDPTFDENYFIDSAEPRFSRALFTDDKARKAVQSLMSAGFDTVTFDDGRISAKLTDTRRESSCKISQASLALHELSLRQPNLPDHLGRDVRASWRAKISGIYVFFSIILALGAGTVYWGFEHYRPIDASAVFLHSLTFSFATFIVSLVSLVLVLRGHSSSHLHICLAALLSLSGCVALGDGLTIYANGYNDRSNANTYRTNVLKKWPRTNRGHTSYRVRVESWRPDKKHQDLVVDRALYKRISVNRDQLIITTRSGNLGYEWLNAPLVVERLSPKPQHPNTTSTKLQNHD